MKLFIFLFALISVLGYTGCGTEPQATEEPSVELAPEDSDPGDEGDDIEKCHKKVKKLKKHIKKLEKEHNNE